MNITEHYCNTIIFWTKYELHKSYNVLYCPIYVLYIYNTTIFYALKFNWILALHTYRTKNKQVKQIIQTKFDPCYLLKLLSLKRFKTVFTTLITTQSDVKGVW